jgi:hypothetical protein
LFFCFLSTSPQRSKTLIPPHLDVLARLLLSFGLLLKVVLDTALLGLALGVLLVVDSLLVGIASQAGNGTTDGALDAVANARAEVVELALGLLLLALEVLLTASLLERLLFQFVSTESFTTCKQAK